MIAALCRRSRNPDEIPRAPNHGANTTVAVACIFLSAALFPLFRVTRRICHRYRSGSRRVRTQQWDAVKNHAIHENMTGQIAPIVGPRRFCDTSPFLDITLSIQFCSVNAHRWGCRVAFFGIRMYHILAGVVEINNSNELLPVTCAGFKFFLVSAKVKVGTARQPPKVNDRGSNYGTIITLSYKMICMTCIISFSIPIIPPSQPSSDSSLFSTDLPMHPSGPKPLLPIDWYNNDYKS